MACHLESLTDSLSGKMQQKECPVFSFTSLTASLAQGNGPSISSILILVLGLLVAVVALAIIAPGLHIPYSILLVLGGLLLGFVPGLPRFTLDPDVVFLLLLPPLLNASAWQTSWRDFHANLRPISLLALGLVLLTTIVVAVVAHVLIPDLPWAVALCSAPSSRQPMRWPRPPLPSDSASPNGS